jgi:hypothetical protein
MEQESNMTEKQSLQLITEMIGKARDAYYDTGVSAIMWGIIIAICSLVKLAEIQFRFDLPVDIYWLTIVAIIPQVIISVRENKNRKVKTYDEPYMDYIWVGFGISILLMIVIVNVMGRAWSPAAAAYQAVDGNKPLVPFYEFITPLFLLLYGLPTFITGAACRFKPMLWGGLICWIGCVVSLFSTIKIDLLLTAFSAIVAWLIPGIILQREYKKATSSLAAANV